MSFCHKCANLAASWPQVRWTVASHHSGADNVARAAWHECHMVNCTWESDVDLRATTPLALQLFPVYLSVHHNCLVLRHRRDKTVDTMGCGEVEVPFTVEPTQIRAGALGSLADHVADNGIGHRLCGSECAGSLGSAAMPRAFGLSFTV